MSEILSIADDALEMILQLREQEGEGEFGLLIEVTGLRGMQFTYELAFVPLADKKPDQTVEYHAALPVIIAEGDVEKLRGSSLLLTEDGLSMTNPNVAASPRMAAAPMGDLSGPLVDRVTQVLSAQVNPAIAMHGGAAELVSVDGSVAYLRLSGGCQGCGLAQVTLRQGIERILLESIPELTEVVDVTDHESGTDPYYEKSKK